MNRGYIKLNRLHWSDPDYRFLVYNNPLLHILLSADKETGVFKQTERRIAEICETSRDKVRWSINRCIKMGILEVKFETEDHRSRYLIVNNLHPLIDQKSHPTNTQTTPNETVGITGLEVQSHPSYTQVTPNRTIYSNVVTEVTTINKKEKLKEKEKGKKPLTLIQMPTVPIPDQLLTLKGFQDAWNAWLKTKAAETQSRYKWKDLDQVNRTLSAFLNWDDNDLDVVRALTDATGDASGLSAWKGFKKSYLRPKPVVKSDQSELAANQSWKLQLIAGGAK